MCLDRIIWKPLEGNGEEDSLENIFFTINALGLGEFWDGNVFWIVHLWHFRELAKSHTLSSSSSIYCQSCGPQETSYEDGISCQLLGNCLGADGVNKRTCNWLYFVFFHFSQGFTFPQEVGYPLDIYQARYYMMETHYHHAMDGVGVNINSPPMVDNSGLRLYYTQALRKYDAGVLSVGKFFF